jgi:hypothetical protein
MTRAQGWIRRKWGGVAAAATGKEWAGEVVEILAALMLDPDELVDSTRF